MVANILVFFLVVSVSHAEPNGSFTAAEYFELVRTDSKKPNWPERVHFKPIDLKGDAFEYPRAWRLVFACSGRPLNGEGLKQASLGPAFGGATTLSGSIQIANASEKTAQPPTLMNLFFDLAYSQDPEGQLVVRDQGSGIVYRPHVIEEQNVDEVIFLAVPSPMLGHLLRPACGNDQPQVILAREPLS